MALFLIKRHLIGTESQSIVDSFVIDFLQKKLRNVDVDHVGVLRCIYDVLVLIQE